MKKIHFLLVAFLLLFFLIKISNFGVRLSDTNIYFSNANQILSGKLIYKDLFYANFPAFPYISAIYFLITGGNINLFFLTSTIEVILITALIYHITYKKTKAYLTSFLTSALYIFSFIVLSTSDHQTGVFSASLFAVLGYLFFERKSFLISGIFLSLSFLTKAYFIPIPLSFFIYLILKKEFKQFLRLFFGFALTSIFIVGPFLILAPTQFFKDIFGFSLTRPTGLVKSEIAWFFIFKDFLLFIILIFNLFNFKKNLLFALISFFSIILFLGFQDIYYLYLNYFVPFLCLSFYEFESFWRKQFKFQKMVIPSFIILLILLNLYVYLSSFRDLQKIQINQIINAIEKEKPNFLYGADDITPALIYISKIPPLEGVIDAHEYFFMRKMYDRNFLTVKAIEKKTIVVTHGAFYPQFGIDEKIVDGIFNKNLILQKCSLFQTFPVKSEGITNRLNLFKCF